MIAYLEHPKTPSRWQDLVQLSPKYVEVPAMEGRTSQGSLMWLGSLTGAAFGKLVLKCQQGDKIVV